MDPAEPTLVDQPEAAAPDPSLLDEVRQLASDGRTLLEAELAYQRSRAALAGHAVKGVAGWYALALSLVFFALMALILGALLALAPLLGAGLATLVVVVAILLVAAFAVWLGTRRWRQMQSQLADEPPA